SSRGGGKENHGNLNTSLKSQRKHTQALHAITDISNNLGNKSLKKSMDTQHGKLVGLLGSIHLTIVYLKIKLSQFEFN
ncbi:unnamed protein product, partial [Rotaria magnacalcarata]